MAFQKAFIDKFGINPPEAYFRVRRAIVDNFPATLNSPPLFTAEIEIFASQADYQAGKSPLDTRLYQLDAADNAAVQQGLAAAYDWLKTLPDFISVRLSPSES